MQNIIVFQTTTLEEKYYKIPPKISSYYSCAVIHHLMTFYSKYVTLNSSFLVTDSNGSIYYGTFRHNKYDSIFEVSAWYSVHGSRHQGAPESWGGGGGWHYIQ